MALRSANEIGSPASASLHLSRLRPRQRGYEGRQNAAKLRSDGIDRQFERDSRKRMNATTISIRPSRPATLPTSSLMLAMSI